MSMCEGARALPVTMSGNTGIVRIGFGEFLIGLFVFWVDSCRCYCCFGDTRN